MFPEASIVYGIDLGQIDSEDIDKLDTALTIHKAVEISSYGEEGVEEYYILNIKNYRLPSVICGAKSFDPSKLIAPPNWDVELQKAITDVDKILHTTTKTKPKWFLIELYGG